MATIQNSLIIKNVTVNELRTSLRLEHTSWSALEDICQFETLSFINYVRWLSVSAEVIAGHPQSTL